MRTLLILSVLIILSFGGCIKERMYFVSGHIFTDCETRTPFANREIRLWDDFRKKIIGTGSTDENGYFRFEYSNNYYYLVLQGVNPYFSIAKNIIINPDNNQNTEFFLSSTYNLKVYLDVVKQPEIGDTLFFSNPKTYNWMKFSMPLSSGLFMTLPNVGVVQPSYPITRGTFRYYLKSEFPTVHDINYNLEQFCGDTIIKTIRLE